MGDYRARRSKRRAQAIAEGLGLLAFLAFFFAAGLLEAGLTP